MVLSLHILCLDQTHIYPTNLKLEKNTINVLLGSTLAGKTTLMQIMAGLDKPTSGEIWFNSENVTGMRPEIGRASTNDKHHP